VGEGQGGGLWKGFGAGVRPAAAVLHGLNFEKIVRVEILNRNNKLPEMRMFDCRFSVGHLCATIPRKSAMPEYLPIQLKAKDIAGNA
jgi:hypothetical protein